MELWLSKIISKPCLKWCWTFPVMGSPQFLWTLLQYLTTFTIKKKVFLTANLNILSFSLNWVAVLPASLNTHLFFLKEEGRYSQLIWNTQVMSSVSLSFFMLLPSAVSNFIKIMDLDNLKLLLFDAYQKLLSKTPFKKPSWMKMSRGSYSF